MDRSVIQIQSGPRKWLVCVVAVVLVGCFAVDFSSSRARAWGFGDSPTTAFGLEGFAGAEFGAQGGTVVEDANGNFFLVGTTAGTLDVDPSSTTLLVGDGSDALSFVAKYSTSGSLLWAHHWPLSSGRNLSVFSYALGADGSIILGGETPSYDLDPTSGVDSVVTTGYYPFIMRINADGSYGWGHTYPLSGSSPSGQVRHLQTTASGEIIASFEFEGTMSLLGASITSAGNYDAVVAKLSIDGTTRVWHTSVGGTGAEWTAGIQIAPDGGVFLAGGFTSSSITVRGSDSATSSVSRGSSVQNSYFVSLTSTGTVRAAVGRETLTNVARAAVVRPSGSLLVELDNGELLDVSTTGAITSVGQFARSVGATTVSTRMVYLPSGALIISGTFSGTVDFDPTSGTASRTASVGSGYIVHLTSSLALSSVQVFGASVMVEMTSTSPSRDGGFYAVGRSIASSLNLSNTSYAGTYTRAGSSDSFNFIIKYDAAGNSGVPTTTTTTTTTTPPTTTVPAVNAPISGGYSPGNGKATLRWEAVSGATSYVVTSSSGVVKCTTASTTCALTKLKNGKSYNFSIRAVNSANVASANSLAVKVVPGFSIKKTVFKVKSKPALATIISTPSTGLRRWTVSSGLCKLVGTRLVAPAKAGRCSLRLSVAKKGKYPAMSVTAALTIRK